MFKSLWSNAAGNQYGSYLGSLESADLDNLENPETGEAVGDADTEITDMAVESAELSQDVDAVQRTTNAADIGEGVAAVSAQIAERGNATPEEAALVQAGAAQTAAAAGANPSEIADAGTAAATESNGSYVVSTEGFIETLKKIWQGIKDFVAKWIQKAKNWFNRMWNSTASVLKKVEKIREKLKEKKEEWAESELKLKPAGFMKDLAAASGEKFSLIHPFTAFEKFYTASAVKDVNDLTKKAVDDIKNKSNEDLEKFTTDYKKTIETILGVFVTKNAENGSLEKYLGKNYKGLIITPGLGNFAIVSGFCDDSSLAPQAMINSYTCRGVKRLESWNPLPTSKDVKWKKPEPKLLSKGLDNIKSTIEGLENWYNTGSKEAFKKVDDLRESISKAVDKINEGDNAARKDGAKVMQRLFVLPTQFLRGNMDYNVHVIRTASSFASYIDMLVGKLKSKDSKKD